MSKQNKYSTALAELEQLVYDIENDNVSVDELSEKVQRATTLISLCKSILTKTEKEVSEALEALENSEPPINNPE